MDLLTGFIIKILPNADPSENPEGFFIVCEYRQNKVPELGQNNERADNGITKTRRGKQSDYEAVKP
jgi:hypothetical protein